MDGRFLGKRKTGATYLLRSTVCGASRYRVPAGAAMEIEFKLLGSAELLAADGHSVAVAPQLWCVLVSLLLVPNVPVATEVLIDRLWGDDPPPKAKTTIRSYVWRIDRALSQAARESAYISRQVLQSLFHVECLRAGGCVTAGTGLM
jgi:hypothetical protein